eukprot:CAMPEP_0118957526 /NCGR_PEP_ID=MMETSP1169-20130426/62152_1 /TAXON_ID=36882 /ORGANISM="Pyramimonas obovata, Strain CCMP722" /LENGTH=126 /DNA_ID=CAMNT_0006905611 /DNA_START=569 /DNA_END=950 /DNA_ORIENTATION=+
MTDDGPLQRTASAVSNRREGEDGGPAEQLRHLVIISASRVRLRPEEVRHRKEADRGGWVGTFEPLLNGFTAHQSSTWAASSADSCADGAGPNQSRVSAERWVCGHSAPVTVSQSWHASNRCLPTWQ